MKKLENKKLSLKKFRISKINHPQKIFGGTAGFDDDDDDSPTRPTIIKD